MKLLVSAALAVLAFGTPANAAVTYKVMVDTSSQRGKAGFIDLQFGPGCLGAACDTVAQPAFAAVSRFATDGTLAPFDAASPYHLAFGTSGTLPGTVRFDNQTATPEDFTQGLTFGDTLSFEVTLSGPAIEAPLNTGGNYNGTGFFFSFINGDFTSYLFADDSGPFAGTAGALHVQQDGSVLAVANPSGQDYTRPSGLSFVTIAPAAVPEPASWALMLAGFGSLGITLRRKRNPAPAVA